MKKRILFFILFTAAFFANAQGFDDMAYPNTDFMTYFQQEMSSLMQFQAAHNINIPFFASFSGHFAWRDYSVDYLDSIGWPARKSLDTTLYGYAATEINGITGFQFKLNDKLYLPVLFSFGAIGAQGIFYEGEIVLNGTAIKDPLFYSDNTYKMFLGSGLFMNTDVFSGGVFMGWGFKKNDYGFQVHPDMDTLFSDDNFRYNKPVSGFKIAFVPMVKTTSWKYVGRVLDNVLGFLGWGDFLLSPLEDKDDLKTEALANAINIGLNFTFNRIYLGPLSLDVQSIYTRGNFDPAAKSDTYGLKLTGLFNNFPFGFSVEGGYEHIFSIMKYFESEYDDTGYFNGSLFFPLKHLNIGIIYQYDYIRKSSFSIALSASFFSGFGIFPPVMVSRRSLGLPHNYKYDGELNFIWGLRYRHNGWNVK